MSTMRQAVIICWIPAEMLGLMAVDGSSLSPLQGQAGGKKENCSGCSHVSSITLRHLVEGCINRRR